MTHSAGCRALLWCNFCLGWWDFSVLPHGFLWAAHAAERLNSCVTTVIFLLNASLYLPLPSSEKPKSQLQVV